MNRKAGVFIRALENTGGIIKNAAEAIGCSRQTVYNAIQTYPSVARALDEEREKLKDLVEERLIDQIQQGNMTAIIWYSKTQMKDRGYVERHEHTGSQGGPIETNHVHVYLPQNGRDGDRNGNGTNGDQAPRRTSRSVSRNGR